MTALEYLDYLILAKKTEDGLHTIPIQMSELQCLRALMNAEQKIAEAAKK
jgi:hypothetical protein